MTADELKNRYGIKLSYTLGKPLYIQDVDALSDFKRNVPSKLFTLLFFLFGSGIAVFMLYGAITYDHPEYFLFGVLFVLFFMLLYKSLKTFFDVELIVVGDKGVVRYILSPKGKIKKEERILFSHSQLCELYEGPIDPYSPIARWRGYKHEAKWFEGKEEVFRIAYFPSNIRNKDAMNVAMKAFTVYCITRKE